jgi:hypothetical protein
MLLSFVPVILGSNVLIAAAGLPGIDPQKLCHASERRMPDLGGEPMQTLNSCMMDEQEAREKLLQGLGDLVRRPTKPSVCAQRTICQAMSSGSRALKWRGP